MVFNQSALNRVALNAAGFPLVTGTGAITIGDVVSAGSGSILIPVDGSGSIVISDVVSSGAGHSGAYGSGAIVIGPVLSRARVGFQWVATDSSIWTEQTVSTSTWTEAA